jgi:ABC-type sugar transport system ATPase subunit
VPARRQRGRKILADSHHERRGAADGGRHIGPWRARPLQRRGRRTPTGVETVYQDLALCPNLDVIHNLVLGAEPVRRVFGLRFRDEAAAGRLARERLKRLGSLVRDHRALVRDLSGGQRQAIAIARAAGADSKLVILDEPTAALGVIQKHQVLEVIRSLADHGTAVILITHDVSMVEAVADRAVVLRLGRVVYDGKTEGLTQLDLLHLMAGEPIAAAKTEIPLR